MELAKLSPRDSGEILEKSWSCGQSRAWQGWDISLQRGAAPGEEFPAQRGCSVSEFLPQDGEGSREVKGEPPPHLADI